MSATEPFWPRRLRWRLVGAWRWPAFAAFTLLDAAILDRWSPVGFDFNLATGLIVASFGNLGLLVAMDALARFGERRRRAPAHPASALSSELSVDRAALAGMAGASIVLLLVGLLSQRTVVSPTEATERNARLVSAYVSAHGSEEVKRNLDTANTVRLEAGYFRTCVALDDRTRAFCLFVDTNDDPPTVRRDPNPAPNGRLFGRDRR